VSRLKLFWIFMVGTGHRGWLSAQSWRIGWEFSGHMARVAREHVVMEDKK